MIRPALLAASLVAALHMAAAGATPQVVSLSDYCPVADPGDTSCIGNWLAAGSGKDLYVPPGTWHYRRSFRLASNMHIRCAGPGVSVFKNMGGTGDTGDLFVTGGVSVENVVVEGCGFDLNGAGRKFVSVIGFNPAGDDANADPYLRNVHVRGNRIFDSHEKFKGRTSPVQRDAIALLDCEGCWVEGNNLSEGARIKVGRPGQRVFVRGNVLVNANDNAIAAPGRTLKNSRARSSEIVIEGNVLINPKVTGIFFGADGEGETHADLAAYSVLVSGNQITGDWITSCIQGTLPARAGQVQVVHNTCIKTGLAGVGNGGSVAGIGIKRVDLAKAPSQQVLVGSNIVGVEGQGQFVTGGIFVTGAHAGLRVTGNHVRNPHGDAAIHFKNMIVTDAVVTDNAMEGTGLAVNGALTANAVFTGILSGNVVVAASGAGMRFEASGTQLIGGSAERNTVRGALGDCVHFKDGGKYQLHLSGNALSGCGGVPIAGEVAGSVQRLHNRGDSAPHASPRRHLQASRSGVTFALPANGTASVDVKVPGARRGDIAGAGFDGITGGNFQISAVAIAADTVRVVIRNPNASAATLTGRVRVQVWRLD